MQLRSIRLQDFRNIGQAALEFDGDRCFFIGSNGQGKTNLLEAIGYVTALRAFRPGGSRVLIREGAREAAIAYGFSHEKLGDVEVLVRIRRAGKEVTLDRSPVRRLSDVIGRFPTVMFSSDDIQLVRGSPAQRRRFLDLHLAGAEPGYLAALQAYHRALDSRNRLLKKGASPAQFGAFERPIAVAGLGIMSARRRSVEQLGPLASGFHAALSGEREAVSIQYKPDIEATDVETHLRLLEASRPRDLALRATQRGPHRDDLVLTISNLDASTFASEGQQRALVLSLRFAQLRDLRSRAQIAPVVLADDVLGELDPDRRRRFWAAMDRDLQVFASGTEPPEDAAAGWLVHRVEAGNFIPERSQGG